MEPLQNLDTDILTTALAATGAVVGALTGIGVIGVLGSALFGAGAGLFLKGE